jgi:ABC-type Fe3+ transport system substrate-binding protein
MRTKAAMLVAAAFVAACMGTPGSSSASQFGPDVQQLIKASRSEGTLHLLWPGDFLSGGQDVTKLENALNQYFGTNIKISFTAGPAQPQLASEVIQAAKAGAPAPTDVWSGVAGNAIAISQADAGKRYPWAELAKQAHINLPPGAIGPQNSALAFGTQIYAIYYNTDKISRNDVPKTFAALLDPKWKGRVASNSYATGLYQLAAAPRAWGYARTKAFVRKFADQIGGLIRCNDLSTLLTGQFDLFAPACGVAYAVAAESNHQPLGFVIPSDAPLLDFQYLGVPATSANPASGALLTLFMLTPAGQKIAWEGTHFDLHFFPASHAAHELGPIMKSGVHITLPPEYDTNPDLTKYQAEFTNLLSHQ